MTDTIFEPKPYSEIVAGMVEQVRSTTDKLTDFNVGSVTRSLLEANAVELDDYYQAVHAGLLRAIPTSIFIGFGFELLPAVAASGVILLTRTGSTAATLTIPAGTKLISTAGAYYSTLAAATFAIGSATTTVIAAADVAGIAGNADPNTLALASGSGTVSATNSASMAGGLDVETDEQRAERFQAWIKTLANCTIATLEYHSKIPTIYDPDTGVAVERAQYATAEETVGHVNLWIHNGSFGASPELLAAVQAHIDGYRDPDTDEWVGGHRPAGMRVDVRTPAHVALDVSLELSRTASSTAATVISGVRGAIERVLMGIRAGEQMRPIDLVNAALSVPGVTGCEILAPTAAQTVGGGKMLYLDTLSVTWVG